MECSVSEMQLKRMRESEWEKSSPEELIEAILLNLPVKSLLRFRCVCKSWFNLIESPSFIDQHLNKNHNHDNLGGIRLVICGSASSISRPFDSSETHILVSLSAGPFNCSLDHSVEVCQPCNGLFCFSYLDRIVLCNPAMRQIRVLPPRPFPCPEGFDCLTEAVGLGFDSNSNYYKVVRIVRIHPDFLPLNFEDMQYRAEVYNLSTNTWRQIDGGIDMLVIDHRPGMGTFFNDSLHCILSAENRENILSFNLSTEVSREIELPNIDPDAMLVRLMVLNRCLALFVSKFPYENKEQLPGFIWVMHQYGITESWKQHIIIRPPGEVRLPFALWNSDLILPKCFGGVLVLLAVDAKEMVGPKCPLGMCLYRESLISIK